MRRSSLEQLADLTRALFAACAADDQGACERLISTRSTLVADLALTFSRRGPSAAERQLFETVGITASAAETQLAARMGELRVALAQLREARVAVRGSLLSSETRSTLGRA